MLHLLLLTAQIAATPVYDDNGNTLAPTGPTTRAVGTLLGTINGPTSPTSGAAWTGTELATISGYDGLAQIYNLNPATGAVNSTVTIIDSGDFGLGYDDSRSLYITTNALTDVITTFNTSGALQSQWYVGGGPVGAAYDGTRDLYWVCDWSANSVYSMNPLTGAIGSTWSTSAVGCTRPAGVAYDDATDTIIVGGRDQSAIFMMDPDTGALVGSSFAANDGGNNPQGLAATNASTVWQTSWNSSLLSEFDLGGPSGPSLTITGSCPGLMTFDVSGATAFGGIAIAYGPAGSFTIPNGSCAGTSIGISGPTLAGIFGADLNGDLNFSATIPGGACGLTVQAVDLGTCSATNTATL